MNKSRAICRGFAFILLVLPFIAAAGCSSATMVELDFHDRIATFSGKTYSGGSWRAVVRGVTTQLPPGSSLDWDVEYAAVGDDYSRVAHSLERVSVALAARRMNDADGRYKDQDGAYASTYLTPSGLPVEGFQYLIANSQIGGPYRTPLDYYQEIPREQIRLSRNGLSFHLPVHATLAKDFPPGLYRIEVDFFATVDGLRVRLPVLPQFLDSFNGCNTDYQYAYFAKLLLPPMKIGTMRQPRVIWTLFSLYANQGNRGAVAREDAAHFAMTSRVRLPTRYVLPCQPDREKCEFPIAPDLPTLERGYYFITKQYPYRMLEPDYQRSTYQVEILKPDGGRVRLGSFVVPRSHSMFDRAPTYRFDQFGRYEITMTGVMLDRFGNRFAAGGTYDVWVAYPLTFATGVKPGTPLHVGEVYPPAATINPPLPAEVEADVKFFPATHPRDVLTAHYSGRAQRFGYYFPSDAQPTLRFPEPGEYLFEITAFYRDPGGRVFMGDLKNASVVLPAEPNLTVVGVPDDIPDLRWEVSPSLDGSMSYNQNNLHFPRQSGHMIYLPGNASPNQLIHPVMFVHEPTGRLHAFLQQRFPKALLALSRDRSRAGAFGSRFNLFPACQEQIRRYARGGDEAADLPLVSATSLGYSPYEYPELVTQRGYYYIATSRPGFPVFFTISDSTSLDIYWSNAFGDYAGTVGAAKRGDQPGDVTWSLVSAFFADQQSGAAYSGVYSVGGSTLLRGETCPYTTPPFTRPVAAINGEEMYIYAGVGPAPGAMYETGAVKGVGSVVVPMAAHNVEIIVRRPDGSTFECRGRADSVGNFTCPAGPLVLDQPGVYRVYSRFEENGRVGTCPGAPGGSYQIYAVDRDSPYRVLFADDLPRRLKDQDKLPVSGSVNPAIKQGAVYYSVVAPGMLLDEGRRPLTDGRFSFDLFPAEFSAQFTNLQDQPDLPNREPLGLRPAHWPRFLRTLFRGERDRRLTDTIEVAVFVEGRDADGRPATAGAKFILRGDEVVVPPMFLARRGGRRP